MTSLLRLTSFLCIFTLLGIAFSPAPTQAQDAPFITIWDTENPGASNNDQIIIPGVGTSYTIEWEEVGTTSNSGSETGSDTHTVTFPSPGLYRIKISGDFTRIHFGQFFGSSNEGEPQKIEVVEQWGDIKWKTMNQAFSRASNLDIQTDAAPDLSRVESMQNMFLEASSLTASQSRMSEWNVSNVTDMSGLFSDATSFNQDISKWDVSNVEDMNFMFFGAESFNQDVGKWNVSNVNNMSGLFYGAISFTQDISSWDVSGVTDMGRMFQNADSFNRDISGWNVSNVKDMIGMFRDAESFNQDISGWDVSSVEDMRQMFMLSTSFDQDISSWDVSNVTRFRVMFKGASSFNKSLGRWDVSSVESGFSKGMDEMFDGTNISTKNYDQTIVGWSVQGLNSNIELGASSLKYCNSGPLKNHIDSGFSWSIEDLGKSIGCPKTIESSGNKRVDKDGTFDFTKVMDIYISGVIGSGRVTTVRFNNAPRNVDKGTPKSLRFVIAGGGITFFDKSELRIDVSELGKIDQPTEILVFHRSIPGNGSFSQLPTSYNQETGELVAEAGAFGEFAFADEGTPLPVEISSFDGTASDGSARLTWQTASETNNAGFEVQRQKEMGWSQVGYVDSKVQGGTTTESQSYGYSVEDLSVGTHQFRLRQVDLGGGSELTDPISVEVQMQEAVKLGTVAPNPVSDIATFAFAVKERSETTIRLYNTLGQKVKTVYQGTPRVEDEKRVRFDVSALPSGTYFLQLDAVNRSETRQLTVVK